jgi:hypothetical protein
MNNFLFRVIPIKEQLQFNENYMIFLFVLKKNADRLNNLALSVCNFMKPWHTDRYRFFGNFNIILKIATLFIFLIPIRVVGQTKNLTLKSQRLAVSSRDFYIVAVEDARKTTSNIGRVYDGRQMMTLVLDGGTAQAIERFVSKNFNDKNNTELMPIYMIIKELKVNERQSGLYGVAGEISMNLTFETYRDGQRVFLTNGSATSTYTRSIDNFELIDQLIRTAIENQLKGFVKWFKDSSKSDKLAKRVQVIFDEDTLKVEAGDTVYYNKKRKLNWKDFKGGVQFGSRWAAQVFTSFGFESRARVNNRVVELRVKTFVWLDKTMSWVRPDAKNDYTLAHEQLHFDITKLIAERFKRKVSSMTFTVEDFSSEIQYQYLELYRELNDTQSLYDGETNHGLNTADQARWIEKIKKELNNFK